ncbi:hypothetical protein [Ensifer sp. ENS12]|uniref:hypothetical protein n=1 Tax=Ensifer sp. ENS12 TaxID=2854774 RepID=UPI001C490B6F|nr:hypothetical protein [Ensifer sp. ENS12]MBV7518857.1 hypothetical protein [Ensifer sp. ENS12]
MTVTLYTQYVRQLKATIDQVRERPSRFESATIQLAICRNGFGYKSTDLLQRRCLTSQYQIGPIHAEAWEQDDGTAGRKEIEHFFQLPEIYAYSDLVLTFDRSPLLKAHWDATIGLVDMCVTAAGGAARKQRMLFIGFTDSIHAEFSLSVDDALLVHDHRTGTRFFEWVDEDVPRYDGERGQAARSPLTRRSQRQWSRLRSQWWGGLSRKRANDPV